MGPYLKPPGQSWGLFNVFSHNDIMQKICYFFKQDPHRTFYALLVIGFSHGYVFDKALDDREQVLFKNNPGEKNVFKR